MQKDLLNAPITEETNHANWKAGVKRKHARLPNLCGGSDTNGKEFTQALPLEERDDDVAEMERLAESGDRNAQYLMGKLLRDGPLLIPDTMKAQYWFERAAMQGHVTAQYALGKLLISDDMEVRSLQEGLC